MAILSETWTDLGVTWQRTFSATVEFYSSVYSPVYLGNPDIGTAYFNRLNVDQEPYVNEESEYYKGKIYLAHGDNLDSGYYDGSMLVPTYTPVDQNIVNRVTLYKNQNGVYQGYYRTRTISYTTKILEQRKRVQVVQNGEQTIEYTTIGYCNPGQNEFVATIYDVGYIVVNWDAPLYRGENYYLKITADYDFSAWTLYRHDMSDYESFFGDWPVRIGRQGSLEIYGYNGGWMFYALPEQITTFRILHKSIKSANDKFGTLFTSGMNGGITRRDGSLSTPQVMNTGDFNEEHGLAILPSGIVVATFSDRKMYSMDDGDTWHTIA
ncbi:MAG: hypothetical protein HF312_15415 [Ignavibacteria bacterium]|jgi:hypothetical protein|nr:hypothetical protein [Ignavibacteria bacterium]